MTFELEHYSIAIRRRNDKLLFEGNMSPFEEIVFPFSDRFWAADPFLVEQDSDVYLFYELFDNVEQKGKIAYSKLNGNKADSPKIVLDEPYHLSFPNVFKIKGEFYMIPETGGNHCIELFKAIKFPDEWKLVKVLVNKIDACDTVVLEQDGVLNLLTSEMDTSISEYPWCYVRNRLFRIEANGLTKEKTIGNNIGDFGARNGGGIIDNNNHLVRVGQDCSGGMYGKGIVFWEMSENFEDVKILSRLTAEDAELLINWHDQKHVKLKGTHTYNISRHYEVIDASEDREYSVFIKYINKVRRKILKVWKKS